MRFFLTLVIVLVVFSGFAQSGMISGNLVDKNSQKAIPFCTIILNNSLDSAVNGAFSNEEGKFNLNEIKFGKYYLSIQSLTHETYKTRIFELSAKKPFQTFENITLLQTGIKTDEVTINVERAAVKIEPAKKTFDVKATGADAGGTAVDVLNTLPSVDVDDNGTVSLRGNSNIRVLIDGIPAGFTASDITTVINQLPANSIETVEVITVPSVKYDPEGIGGIINIVLKKEKKKGYQGSINISYSTMDKLNSRISLNLNKKKFSINSSYSYVDGSYWFSRTSANSYALQDSFVTFNSNRDGIRREPSHNANIKLGYRITGNTQFLIDGTINYMHFKTSDSTDFFWNYNDYKQEEKKRISLNNGNRLSKGLQFSSSTKLKNGNKIDFLSRYNSANNPNRGDFTEPYLIQKENKVFEAQSFVTQLDVKFEIKKAAKDTAEGNYINIESGFKTANRQFNEDFTFFEFSPSLTEFVELNDFSNNLLYGEDVYAGYGLLNIGTEKIDFSAGIRGEYSTIVSNNQGNNYNKSLLNFFPSASIVHKYSEKKSLTISYSKRIKRPRGKQLNPIPSYSDPYNFFIGNADLIPEKSHMSELSYLSVGTKNIFNATLFYQFRDDRLGRLSFTDSSGTSTVLWINFKYHQTLGLELFSRYKFNKKFSVNGSSTFYQTWVDGENFRKGYYAAYFGFDLKINLQFKLRKNTNITWTGDYNSRRVAVVGIVLPRGGSDLSLKHKVLKNKGSLTVRLTDLFRTRRFGIDVDTDGWLRDVRYRYESQLIWIGFNYNFGQSTFKAKNKFRRISPNDRTF